MLISFKHLRMLVLAVAIALGIILSLGQPIQAQISLPEGFGQSNNVAPPSNVTRYGNLESMAVESPLNLQTLFTIASPTVYNRSPDALDGRQTVEQRAEEISARLLLLLNRPMNPEALAIDVSQLNNIKIIEARDDQFTEPLVLMSVTELDTQLNGLPVDGLAEQWRKVLEEELRTGLENLPQNRERVRQILFWLVLPTAIVGVLKYRLSRRQTQLRQPKKAIKAAPMPGARNPLQAASGAIAPDAALVERCNQLWQRRSPLFSLDRQLGILSFAQWLPFWLLIFAWFGGGLGGHALYTGLFGLLTAPIDAHQRRSSGRKTSLLSVNGMFNKWVCLQTKISLSLPGVMS